MKSLIIRSAQRAFTLIELLAVLTILGIIIGVVAPAINGKIKAGRINSTKVQLNSIEQSLSAFNLDCGFFPTTEQGLQALITAPTIGKTCKNFDQSGYWSKKEIPEDPWGSKFSYVAPGTVSGGPYDLSSAGPDKEPGNEDDIKSWE